MMNHEAEGCRMSTYRHQLASWLELKRDVRSEAGVLLLWAWLTPTPRHYQSDYTSTSAALAWRRLDP